MIANLYILRVRQESHLVGKRFGELSLRVAGSNLLAVERSSRLAAETIRPTAQTQLLANDILLVDVVATVAEKRTLLDCHKVGIPPLGDDPSLSHRRTSSRTCGQDIDRSRHGQMTWAGRWLRRLLLLLAVIVITLLVGRAVQSQMGPPLELWHTFIPAEPHAAEIDRLDWDGYMAAEAKIFAAIRTEITERLEEDERRPDDRYFAGSPVYPGAFAQDWNRSYVLEPAGHPVGAVVLLHGLTNSPYSLRHVAKLYQARGFLAIGLRFPGHGTVPAALTNVSWEDWLAATRLSVREARRRVPSGVPLHLVGYSAGGAAALKYALDALEDPRLSRPDRLVLISPMIGVSTFARFAGLAALPASLPPFAKAAWLTVVPEFNPFKYNSFPVNAARQAHRLTAEIQQQLDRLTASGSLGVLAPILTFSVIGRLHRQRACSD